MTELEINNTVDNLLIVNEAIREQALVHIFHTYGSNVCKQIVNKLATKLNT